MYQITTNPDAILRTTDGAHIPRGHRWWYEYEAWLADGNTPQPIPGQTLPERIASRESALVAHINACAASRRWDSIDTAASRAGYPGPYQAEGIAWGQWRDACWIKAIEVMQAVMSGTIPEPTDSEFVAMMPTAPMFTDVVVMPPKNAS